MQTGSYFENSRVRDLDKRQFVFDSKRVNNSPYVMIRGKGHLELVKEGNPNDLGFRHNNSYNMGLSPQRPNIVQTMGHTVHENRFDLPDKYDKSTYLAKSPRVRSIIPFERDNKRDANLMAKGGNSLITKSSLDENGKVPYYNCKNKSLSTVNNLDKLTPNFNRNTGRKASFGNLYRDDDDLSPDHYDSVKIAKADIKSRKRSHAFVDMNKQTKRDFSKMLETSDFYRNVKQQNERSDFIKKLLRDADE